MIKKNVASQKVAFLMVDATDFATPETGQSVTAKYSKDGAALSTCSNSVSEVTSGLYVITLAATETNADVCAYQFLNASCADQWVIVYPETITSIASNVLSTLDDNVASELTAIKSDVAAVYSALSDCEATLYSALSDFEAQHATDVVAIKSDITQVYSSLSDAEATIVSDVAAVYSALSDFEAQTSTDVTAIKSDITAVYSALSDLEKEIVSDVTAVKSSVSDVLAMVTGNSDILSQILVDTSSTLDNKFDSVLEDTTSILVDTKTTLDNKVDSILSTVASILVDTKETTSQTDSILADTRTLSNATYGLDALETLASDILSTLDDNVADKLTSILADTGTTLPAAISDILSTVDGAGIKPVTAEPAAGAPSKTASTGVKIDYLYTVFRNKIETDSAVQKLYADDGATVLMSCAVSDDGTTFTKGEHA